MRLEGGKKKKEKEKERKISPELSAAIQEKGNDT